MTTPNSKEKIEAGSQLHLLDLLDSGQLLPALRGLIADLPFQIVEDAQWQPKGRSDRRESVLVGRNDPFLSSDASSKLRNWWLVHRKSPALPKWDLVVTARHLSGSKALILVEAKAHASEFKTEGKRQAVRETPEEQARSDANHERIADAIGEASAFLGKSIQGLLLTRDAHFQFANRVAFAWKLATLGMPIALVYLGFTGDTAISKPGDFFADDHDWHNAFRSHISSYFPTKMLDQEIDCGLASFWVLCRSLPSLQMSPELNQRRVSR